MGESLATVLPIALIIGRAIVLGNIDLLATYWLLTAIVLYLFALGYAILVQGPTVAKVIERETSSSTSGVGRVS